MKKMLFAELDLAPFDKKRVVKWIESLPERYWFWDSYRECYMLPLMTKTGGFGKSDTENSSNTKDFLWTDFSSHFIREYFENHIFNWTKTKSRIVIIRTMPKKQNRIHIDCSPEAFNTIQYKFRIVVQGASDSLYFETRNGKVKAPVTEKPFIMDGSWPHGMINDSTLVKYTICLGSPWTQSDHYPGLQPLLFMDMSELPISYSKYFHPKYL